MLGLYVDNSKMAGYAQRMMGSDCESHSCGGCKICPGYSGLVIYDRQAVEIVKKNIELIVATLNQRGL
jgi:hypothetical protein